MTDQSISEVKSKPFWQSKSHIAAVIIALAVWLLPGVDEFVRQYPMASVFLQQAIAIFFRSISHDKLTLGE